jgi:hypothetical protein
MLVRDQSVRVKISSMLRVSNRVGELNGAPRGDKLGGEEKPTLRLFSMMTPTFCQGFQEGLCQPFNMARTAVTKAIGWSNVR